MKKIILMLLFLFSCSEKIERGNQSLLIDSIDMKTFFEARNRVVKAQTKLGDEPITLYVYPSKTQRNNLAKLLYSQNRKKRVRVQYEKKSNEYRVVDVRLLP